MTTRTKPICQSVTLPAHLARRERAMARTRRVSQSRVIGDLIEIGLDAKERERHHYLDLLERLRSTDEPLSHLGRFGPTGLSRGADLKARERPAELRDRARLVTTCAHPAATPRPRATGR